MVLDLTTDAQNVTENKIKTRCPGTLTPSFKPFQIRSRSN